ncbi:MAG TPA: response regulator transcription factor, partial [Chthoniobacteraceae bacterium]|nr:response regulator transcription factor [Chthoniobacteraceae bacterium]
MKTKAPPKTRVFLVEDHQIVRQGLARLINMEADLKVCGEASNASDALAQIPALKPDLVLTDISMSGMNGIEFLKHLKARYPEMPAVVLSMHDEAHYAERAFRAGALAFVMKRESTDEMLAALRKARCGEHHVSERVGKRIFQLF